MKLSVVDIEKKLDEDIMVNIERNLAFHPEFIEKTKIIAKDFNVKMSDIYIHYHSVVDQFCIYIKGQWSGYISDLEDGDEEVDQ